MSELKPYCLHCGEPMRSFPHQGNWWFQCKCGARSPSVWHGTERDAIAAWNHRADHSGEANGMVSNADRIRSLSDEELAEFLLKWIACDKEGFMCHPKEYKESGKCDGRCVAGRIDWLRQPAKEETE